MDYVDIAIKVVIPIIGAVILYIAIPYFKSKTSKEQRDDIYFWVKIAVSAAEQIYQEKGQGGAKKEYVLQYLNDKSIKISEEDLDNIIEAAVYEMNKWQGELVGDTINNINVNTEELKK